MTRSIQFSAFFPNTLSPSVLSSSLQRLFATFSRALLIFLLAFPIHPLLPSVHLANADLPCRVA